MTTLIGITPGSTDPGLDGMDEMARWLRGFADQTKAPAGQPNLVYENLHVIAAHLEQYANNALITKVDEDLVRGTAEFNAMLTRLCTGRRADTKTPCEGKASAKCADCPRRNGRSLTKKILAG